jgi:hypothetical protein
MERQLRGVGWVADFSTSVENDGDLVVGKRTGVAETAGMRMCGGKIPAVEVGRILRGPSLRSG